LSAKDYNNHQLKLGTFSEEHVVALVKFWQDHHNLEADGYCGPRTQQTLNKEINGSADVSSALGLKALEIATKELGNGEIGGNNSGPHIARYKGIPDDGNPDDDGAWCASFVSYCCKLAADELNVKLPFKTSHGAKGLYKRISKAGSKATYPMPGDVVCWDRGAPGSWQGHIGFVEKYEHGRIYTIEGNSGRFPSVVKRRNHDLNTETRLIGFGRMP